MANRHQNGHTIITLQSIFLNDQIRLLCHHTFNPSKNWHVKFDASDKTPLPDTIESGLKKADDVMATHCRRVWAPQATQAVADRVEDHYFARLAGNDRDIAQSIVLETGEFLRESINLDDDLTSMAMVSSLPSIWPIVMEGRAMPVNHSQYAHLADRLSELVKHRSQIQQSVGRLKGMKIAVQKCLYSDTIFNTYATDSQTRLQENIITRRGEVEKELERMKMLLARVGGHMGIMLPPQTFADG